MFLLLNGVAFIDYRHFEYITSHFRDVSPLCNVQTLYSSPLTFFIGYPFTHLLGTNLTYHLLGTGSLALFGLLLVTALRKNYPSGILIPALILASTPLFFILTHWMGKSDSFLLAGVLALIQLPRQRGLALTAVGTLVMLCHQDIGTILLVTMVILELLAWGPSLISILLGRGLIWMYHHLFLSHPPISRIDFALTFIPKLIDNVQHAPTAMIFWTLGYFWFWIFLLPYLRRREWLLGLFFLAVTLTTLDFTRVFTLMVFPLIWVWTQRLSPVLTQETQRTPAWLWTLALMALFPFQVQFGFMTGSTIGNEIVHLLQLIP